MKSLTNRMNRACAFLILAATFVASLAVDIGSKPHAVAQAAADLVREVAGTEIAFLPAGLLKEPTGDLSTLSQFPGEGVAVVQLTGTQVRQAMERSLANYPAPHGAFLQVSGITVTFSEAAAPESRVIEIKVGDSALAAGRQYTVAMPETLARGALGYFKIWDRTKIIRETGTTLEAVLKGKTGSVKAPRYIAKP